jgi:ribosomal protein S18 acetylase RimI-like enzyme
MNDATIRAAQAADAPDIARLVLVSAERFLPAVFGTGIEAAVCILAAGRGTLFSHAHCWIAEAGGSTAGMLLGYSGREKSAEDPATGWGLLRTLGVGLVRRLGRLLVLQGTIGKLGADEFYVSNVAVYPDFRGRGIGSALLAAVERAAHDAGAESTVLDVEIDNLSAIRLYQARGYAARGATSPMRAAGHEFSFLRMGKPIR